MSADPAAALRALAAAVREGTLLAWAITHAPDGGDPLPGLWAACGDDGAMRRVLLAAEHPVWFAQSPARLCCGDCGPRHTCPRCADAIRAAVPTLTLRDLAPRGGP